jgi:hypothetical protein
MHHRAQRTPLAFLATPALPVLPMLRRSPRPDGGRRRARRRARPELRLATAAACALVGTTGAVVSANEVRQGLEGTAIVDAHPGPGGVGPLVASLLARGQSTLSDFPSHGRPRGFNAPRPALGEQHGRLVDSRHSGIASVDRRGSEPLSDRPSGSKRDPSTTTAGAARAQPGSPSGSDAAAAHRQPGDAEDRSSGTPHRSPGPPESRAHGAVQAPKSGDGTGHHRAHQGRPG